MKIRSFCYALVITAAMAIVSLLSFSQAPKITAYAEEVSSASAAAITVDVYYGDDLSIELNSQGGEKDNYLFLEVLKENKDDSKVSATYCYKTVELDDGGSNVYRVTVDPSFLKIGTKEVYLRAYGDVNTAKSAIATIAAQTPKFTMKYVPGKTEVKDSFTVGKGGALTEADLAQYQYRTLYGSEWSELAGLDLKAMSVAGGTIVVRKQTYSDDGESIIAPVSAEVKVKISAAPKAPKVTIDYVKGLIKLPKAAEIQVSVNGNPDTFTNASGAALKYTTSADKVESLTRDELVEQIAKAVKTTVDEQMEVMAELSDAEFAIIVNSAASEKAAASQPVFVTVKKERAIVPGANKVTVAGATLTYAFDDDKATFSAENAGFEVSYQQKDDKDSWVAVKAGKTVSIKRSKLGTATKIKVRAAGVKEDSKKSIEGQFPSHIFEVTIPAASGSAKSVPKSSDFTFTATSYKLTLNNTESVAHGKVTGNTGMGNITAVYYLSSEEGAAWSAIVPTTAGTYQIAVDVAAGDAFSAGTKITDESWTVTLQEYEVEGEGDIVARISLYENDTVNGGITPTIDVYCGYESVTGKFILVPGTGVCIQVESAVQEGLYTQVLTSAKYKTDVTENYTTLGSNHGIFGELAGIAWYGCGQVTSAMTKIIVEGGLGKYIPEADLYDFGAPANLSLSAGPIPLPTVTVKSVNDGETVIGYVMVAKVSSNGTVEDPMSDYYNISSGTFSITEAGTYQVAIYLEEGTEFSQWNLLTDDSWKFVVTE